MMRLHCLLSFGATPICSSFSVAVTPPVRNQQYPRGIPGPRQSMREKVRDGNSHSDCIKDAVDVAEEEDMVYFVENPDTFWFWRQRRWRRFRDSHAGTLFSCCFCRFGTPWRKATRFGTNSKLAGVRMMCTCRKRHVRLRGTRPTKKIPWTLVAQPYPRGLCRLLAVALCQTAGWCKSERLNVALLARRDYGHLQAHEHHTWVFFGSLAL